LLENGLRSDTEKGLIALLFAFADAFAVLFQTAKDSLN